MGIPIHASLAYGEIEYFWILKDANHSALIDILLDTLRLFRMPLFFIIGGFFAAMSLNKEKFLEKRTKRLLYPLIVFFLILIVPIKSMWLALENKEMFYAGEIIFTFNYIIENFFASSTETQFRHPPNFGHLWFLMYLYLFSIITSFFRRNDKKISYFKSIMLGFVGSFISYFLMKSHWVDQPFQLYPIISLFSYYGVFYLFGFNLYKIRDTKFEIKFDSIILFLGLLLAISRAIIEVKIRLNEMTVINEYFLNFWSNSATWLILIGSLSFFKNKFDKENSKMKYTVDASYYVYLIHLPFVILFHILLYNLDIFWLIKFLLVCLLTLVSSFATWHYFVRNSFIDKFLKGQRP